MQTFLDALPYVSALLFIYGVALILRYVDMVLSSKLKLEHARATRDRIMSDSYFQCRVENERLYAALAAMERSRGS